MALILAFSHLFVVFLILLVLMAWGTRLLQLLRCESQSHLESLLFATGLATGVLEIILFALAAIGHLSFVTAIALFAVPAATAGRAWKAIFESLRAVLAKTADSFHSALERVAALCVGSVLAVGALLAMAPLTGSDAMNYHFTAPLLWNGRRIYPIWSSVPSFFTGQGHLLISLGFAFGNDRISLGLIYLGGVLAAAALFAMSRLLMPTIWAWVSVLIFLATPLVYWQMTTSGSPDIWTAFFVTLSALAAVQCTDENQSASGSSGRWLILAGFYSGAAAGVKYTAWVVPAALVLYILVARRSFKYAFLSGLASLFAGIWPLARNWVWTGDPVFPFLTRLLTPSRVNSYCLSWIVAETGAARAARDLPHLLAFPFAMILSGASRGFGHYFGPLVLLFSPLLFFIPWRKPLVQIAMTFWLVIFLSNLFSSQMGRFLLPAYGLGLALTLAGVAVVSARGFRIAGCACVASILIFLGFAGVSDALYARDFLPAVFGRESERAFLERMAPDYRTAEFINQKLGSNAVAGGKVMVFFRHLYYIRVPFVDGSPEYSWEMDPAIYSDPERLLGHLADMHVQWVVRSPGYPAILEAPFSQLEAEGKLTPVASTEVENLTGTGRMFGRRQKFDVVLLRVNSQTK